MSAPFNAERWGNDAEFIAHAREDVPALCDRVEELEVENAALRARVTELEREGARLRWVEKLDNAIAASQGETDG